MTDYLYSKTYELQMRPDYNPVTNQDLLISQLNNELFSKTQRKRNIDDLLTDFHKLEKDIQTLQDEKTKLEYDIRQLNGDGNKMISDLRNQNENLINEINEKINDNKKLYNNNIDYYTALEGESAQSQNLKFRTSEQENVINRFNDIKKKMENQIADLNKLKNENEN